VVMMRLMIVMVVMLVIMHALPFPSRCLLCLLICHTHIRFQLFLCLLVLLLCRDSGGVVRVVLECCQSGAINIFPTLSVSAPAAPVCIKCLCGVSVIIT
jgi:hypothetical protein